MAMRRWGIPVLALLLVLAAGGAAACGGGDDHSDEAQIEARTKSFVEHLTKGDAKGLRNDVPPAARTSCDEAKIKEAAAELRALKLTVKSTKVTAISGDTATAEITTSIGEGDEAEAGTGKQKFIKVEGTWYLDTEGQSCTEFFG